MWRLQGNGVIFVCCVSVKLRLVFTAGPYWQVVSARCTVWIFIDSWNLRPRNACSLSFLRPALKICVKNADFCVNANPASDVFPGFPLAVDAMLVRPCWSPGFGERRQISHWKKKLGLVVGYKIQLNIDAGFIWLLFNSLPLSKLCKL